MKNDTGIFQTHLAFAKITTFELFSLMTSFTSLAQAMTSFTSMTSGCFPVIVVLRTCAQYASMNEFTCSEHWKSTLKLRLHTAIDRADFVSW